MTSQTPQIRGTSVAEVEVEAGNRTVTISVEPPAPGRGPRANVYFALTSETGAPITRFAFSLSKYAIGQMQRALDIVAEQMARVDPRGGAA